MSLGSHAGASLLLLVAVGACGGTVDSGAGDPPVTLAGPPTLGGPPSQAAADGGTASPKHDGSAPVSQPLGDLAPKPSAKPDVKPLPDQSPPPPPPPDPPKSCPCGAGYVCFGNICRAQCTPQGPCKVDSSCLATETCLAAKVNGASVGHLCLPATGSKGQGCGGSGTLCQNHLVCLSTNGGPYSCQPCPS
ncbi:MAG: hypothetical protein QG573_70 [Acidobacteriota bacterium]|nr:hypothetical protein [Acidobacteriota bacterium]